MGLMVEGDLDGEDELRPSWLKGFEEPEGVEVGAMEVREEVEEGLQVFCSGKKEIVGGTGGS